MRGRFLLGAAAVLSAVSMSGEAQAACSDYLNEARRSTDRVRVQDLYRLATGCSLPVLNGIRTRIGELSGEATDKPITSPVVTPVATTRAPPARTQSFRPLTIGQTVSSRLSAESAIDAESGGVPYEFWSFRAPAGQRLQVSMTSPGSEFDTYLAVGRVRDGRFEEIESNDDRGDGTLNSMLRFTPEETGDYVIRARSYFQGQYGGYELVVQTTASLATAPATPRPLTAGEAVTGRLSAESATDPDGGGYSYDLWSFQAAAGQRLQLSMASNNLDTYLAVGRVRNGRFDELASNDDRGDGTLNSMLRFVPAEAGEYVIRARSYSAEQWGDYELLVQPTAAVSRSTPLAQNANAWVLQGEVSSEAAPRFVDFEFEAARGRRYSVRAISSEFTPILDVGLLQEGGSLAEVDFFGVTDRAPNTAEFVAERRGRYILRVSAQALSSGHFDLIVNEVR